jgi:hypothetical protein
MVGTFDPNCTLRDRDQLGQPKDKARRGGRAPMTTDGMARSDAGHHVFESEEMDERPQLAPLVVAEAHDQRIAG